MTDTAPVVGEQRVEELRKCLQLFTRLTREERQDTATALTHYAALRQALALAGPAVEAGAAMCMQRCLVISAQAPMSEAAEWGNHAQTLRLLLTKLGAP